MCRMLNVMTGLLALILPGLQNALGQTTVDTTTAVIRTLDITTSQTTILVFPAPVRSVDRGCPYILTKTIKGISNVLKVKAASSIFPPSNLTVFTADGSIYGFRVDYLENPGQFLLDYSRQPSGGPAERPLLFTSATETELNRYIDSVAKHGDHHIHARSTPAGGIHCSIRGIYQHAGIVYFKLAVQNRSDVPYHIDFLKYFIRDKHRQKRTVTAEKTMTPLAETFLPDSSVSPHGEIDIVIAFNQFTIANNKQFFIELFEKDGDRRIVSTLKGRQLLKAAALSD